MAGCGPAVDASDRVVVDVAAAASLRPALTGIAAAFAAEHPHTEARIAYGASGSLLAQIRNGAPFALFLSADEDAPAVLHQDGRSAEPFVYAAGRLCVWLPTRTTLDLERKGLAALAEPSVRQIAVANPDHAPYGRAAIAALARAGVLDQVRDRLVFGENVAQAAQFAAGGAADAALVALAQALAPEMAARGRHWLVPVELHPGLRHAGALLPASAERREAAQRFATFLRGPAARAILARHGYGAGVD